MRPILFALSAILFASCMQATQGRVKPAKAIPVHVDSFTVIKLAFAGDIMAHLPQIEAAWNDSSRSYDFTSQFKYISPYLKNADIAAANLETTFGGKPYSGYPQFSAPDTLAYFIKQAGFNLIADANNHAADRGSKGVKGTIEGLNKLDLLHMGTYLDSADKAAHYPLIFTAKRMHIAFLNYTYGTNGLKVAGPNSINYIDTGQIITDIGQAKAKKPDAIIAIMHWGIEYERVQNKEQEKIAGFCLSHGITIVIGSHPHVLQPADWFEYTLTTDTLPKKGLVVYSLGNFVSNQHDRYKDGAMIFTCQLRKNNFTGEIKVDSTAFIPTWVYIKHTDTHKQYYVLPAAEFENDTTLISATEDRNQLKQSLQDTREMMNKTGIPEYHK